LNLKANFEPGVRVVGSRVEETRALSSYGSNWIELVQPRRSEPAGSPHAPGGGRDFALPGGAFAHGPRHSPSPSPGVAVQVEEFVKAKFETRISLDRLKG
jgi:hypothetical protein